MRTGAPVRPMRVPVRPPSVTSRWVGLPATARGWAVGAAPLPRRRGGGGTAMRGWPLVRRSVRITRIAASTNSHNSARKPNRISCSASAEFTVATRSWPLLVEHDARVPDPDHVSVAEQLAADLVPVHRAAVGGAQVVRGRDVAVVLDVEVSPRDALVEQLQVGVGAPADDVAPGPQVVAAVRLVDDEHRRGRPASWLLLGGRRPGLRGRRGGRTGLVRPGVLRFAMRLER